MRVVVRRRLEPCDAVKLPLPEGPVIAFYDWLSPRARDVLLERGASFIDGTGNVDVRLDLPAVASARMGLSATPTRSLGHAAFARRAAGMGAGCGHSSRSSRPTPPANLASALGMDDGYVSRILRVLTEELMIERKPRQPVTAVDWEKVVRQITGDYRCLRSNEIGTWIAPGGPEQFLRDVAAKQPKRCALTGSFSSNKTVIVTAPAVAIVYTDDPERLAKDLRLLPTRLNANVITALPYDPVVYERTRAIDGTDHTSLAQVLIDCLTGMARMPSEGEALLKWMRQNEPRWRSKSLVEPASH